MSALHQFLFDLRWLVLLITLPTGLFFSWKIWLIVSTPAPKQPRTGTVRRPQPRPAGSPPSTTGGVQTNLLDKTTAASTATKDVRVGSADVRPDTKPATTDQLLPKRGEDDEVGKLFDGLDDSLTPKAKAPPAPPKGVGERVSRLEELGFHHSIPKEQVKPTDAPADSRSATETPAPSTPTAPTPPPRAATEADAPQLDDILARLDKVLGDDGDAPKASAPAPAAEAPKPAAGAPMPPSGSPETPKAATTQDEATSPAPPPKAPAWARPDVTDEDLDSDKPDPGRQLGLFDERKKTDDKA